MLTISVVDVGTVAMRTVLCRIGDAALGAIGECGQYHRYEVVRR